MAEHTCVCMCVCVCAARALTKVRMLVCSCDRDPPSSPRQAMKMSGLSDNVLWLSWFATSVIKNGVVCVAMVVVVKVGNLFQHSDVLVLLVFFLLFLMNSIAFSFMASTLFSKARTGGLVGMIVWFLLSTPSYGLGKASVSGTVQVGVQCTARRLFTKMNRLWTPAWRLWQPSRLMWRDAWPRVCALCVVC